MQPAHVTANAALLRNTVLATALAAACGLASASDECGPFAPTLTCAPGLYAGGISYTATGPFTLNLGNGVIADNPGTDPYAGPGYGAGVAVGGVADITINMLPGGASIISGGFYGLLAFTEDGSDGNIVINADGIISGGSTGIYTVTGSGASGSMEIHIAGNSVVTGADYALAAYSQAGSSAAPITVTTAAGSDLAGGTGILVQDDGGGAVSITVDGDIGRASAVQYGIAAVVYNTGSAQLNVNGSINSVNGGIFAGAGGSTGDIAIATGIDSVIVSDGGTYFGAAIEAVQADDRFGNPSTGNIDVVHNGVLNAGGAMGIYASTTNSAGGGHVKVSVNGSVNAFNQAIYVQNSGSGETLIATGADSSIRSSNSGAEAVFASVQSGPLTFNNAGDVFSSGVGGSGVRLSSSSGAIVLGNAATGSIGAISDHALSIGGDMVTVDNAGTLTGTIDLTGTDNRFNNGAGGIFELRNYSDSDGDGSRDTQAVALSNINGVFDNFGIVSLSHVSGAGNVSQAGLYVPAGLASAAIGNGVEQAQLLGVTMFDHAGVITLQDLQTGGGAALAGDVLAITSGTGAGIPGPQAGIFQSNGGSLFLDSVLNQGGSSSLSDILVLDSTALAAGGATSVFIQNAGGMGAQTEGDGIKVIDVLTGSAGSAPGAFSLGNPRLAAGAYDYRLYRSGTRADDGDWYLRSSLRTAVATYAGVAPALTGYGITMTGSLHQRTGETAFGAMAVDGSTPALWARWLYQSTETAGSAFEDVRFDSRFSALQLGLDLWRQQQTDGTSWRAGASLGYGDVGSDTREADRETGSWDSRAVSIGLYATWFGAHRSYLDFVALYNRYSGIDAASNDGDAIRTSADGSVLSLEAGHPFSLGTGWRLEPQAQLVWQDTGINADADGYSQVSFDDSRSVTGRLGIRLLRERSLAERDTSVWLRGDVWHGFDDGGGTRIAALDGTNVTYIDGQQAGTWIELGLGGSLQFDASARMFAEFRYFQDVDGPELDGFNLNIGVKWQWR